MIGGVYRVIKVSLALLGKIHVPAKTIVHRSNVRLQTIRCHLSAAPDALAHVRNKKVRAQGITLANVMRQNQLGTAINRQKRVIALLLRVFQKIVGWE